MDSSVVLAGSTLDRALSLVRLGLLQAHTPTRRTLSRATCSGSTKLLGTICSAAPTELKPLLTPSPAEPVHLFVLDERDVHHGRVAHHVLKASLPAESFLEIADGVLVPSWPLYYVLRCRDLPRLSERLMLGMELCGSYCHLVTGDRSTKAYFTQPHRGSSGELVTRWNGIKIEPALTVAGLATFLGEARGIKGLGPTRQALRYLLCGSASPCESALALMASLPCPLGGYGFQGLQLNPKLDVPNEKRHLTQFDAYHPDGYLEALDTDLEYESDERHTGQSAVVRDKARRNDIQALGIEVKDVTWEMLSHLDSLDLLFEQLLDKERRLGLDPRGRHGRAVRHPDNRGRRRTMLQELLPPWPYEA